MKKLLAVLLLIGLVLCTCAYADGFVPLAPDETVSPFREEIDLGILVGETFFPAAGDFAPLAAALGESLMTESYTGEDGCTYSEYVYDFGSVFTRTEGGIEIWYDILVDGEGIALPRGIAIGSPVSDISALYGSDCYMESAFTWVYSAAGTLYTGEENAVLIEAINDEVIWFEVFCPGYSETVW